MNNTRRNFLGGIGAGIGSATVGCITKTAEANQNDNTEELPEVFVGAYKLRNELREEYNTSVQVVDQPNGTLILTYSPRGAADDEHTEAIQDFAEAYASFSEDYSFDRLDGVISTPQGRTVARWHVQPEWTNLDTPELHSRVERTVVPYEQFSQSQLQTEAAAEEIDNSLYERERNFNGAVDYQEDHSLTVFYTSLSNVTEIEESDTLSEEIGVIAYLYAFLISQGAPIDRLNAMVTGIDTVYIGTWFVERDWAIQFNMAGLTEEEYEEKIRETAENYIVEEVPEDF